MNMTSKERVRAAIQHQTPDRVPCFMKCVAEAAEKLQKHLGLESYDAVLDHLNIDVLNRNGGYILGPSQDFEGDVPVENILALYAARNL